MMKDNLLIDRSQKKTDQFTEREWTGKAIVNALTLAVEVVESGAFAIKKGDVVAFYGNQSDWHAIWLLAVSIVGGVYTGNSDLYPYEEFHHLVQSSSAKFIVASDRSIIKAKKVAIDLHGQVKKVFQLDFHDETSKLADGHSLFNLMRERDEETFHHLDSSNWRDSQCERLIEMARRVSSTVDLYAINFSSGTTGRPKAVGRTHYQAMSILNFAHPSLDMGGREIVYPSVSHFGHVGAMGYFTYALMVGGSVVLSNLDPETWLTAVSKYKITNAMLVPSSVISVSRFANDIANIKFMREHNFSSLEQILVTGEFLPHEISQQFLRTFPSVKKFRQSFGATEMSYVTCVPATDATLENTIYSGIPMAGVSIKILPEQTLENGTTDAKALPAYEIGHILVKSPSTGRYLNNEKANLESFDSEGYFKTGDGGYYDDRGFLLVTDRFKSVIKSDGWQVSPTELEDILLSHPSVREAVVIGVPHDLHGHVPRAFVIAKETLNGQLYSSNGESVNSEEGVMSTIYLEERIKSYVAERVAIHKQIRGGIKFFTSFPQTILGKIDRRFFKIHFSA